MRRRLRQVFRSVAIPLRRGIRAQRRTRRSQRAAIPALRKRATLAPQRHVILARRKGAIRVRRRIRVRREPVIPAPPIRATHAIPAAPADRPIVRNVWFPGCRRQRSVIPAPRKAVIRVRPNLGAILVRQKDAIPVRRRTPVPPGPVTRVRQNAGAIRVQQRTPARPGRATRARRRTPVRRAAAIRVRQIPAIPAAQLVPPN